MALIIYYLHVHATQSINCLFYNVEKENPKYGQLLSHIFTRNFD